VTTPDPRERLRTLAGAATRLRVDLHDLAEDLPTGWERLPDVAARTYEAYAMLARLLDDLGREVPG
jgi:hypothetical protein